MSEARSRERPPVLAEVVAQHIEEAAALRNNRSVLVRSPAAGLLQLARHDERIAAHLDGIRVAGTDGAMLARAAFDAREVADAGTTFTLLTGAIERRETALVAELLHPPKLAPGTARGAARGAASAAGWVSAADLHGAVAAWFDDRAAAVRGLALAACALHRVDPGATLTRLVADGDGGVRARACQAAGELGRRDLADACLQALRHAEDADAPVAAMAALLLGDRGKALDRVHALALNAGPQQAAATALTMLFGDADRGRHLVTALARLPASAAQRRLLLAASGWSGDPRVVPWLLQQMDDAPVARLAAEAVGTIAGIDLAAAQAERLERPARDALMAEADDNDLALDEDDALPWPDPAPLRAWWQREAPRFTPGTRHLLGRPVDKAQLLNVLTHGTQRVRRQAALLCCANDPGTPLFNVAAPAWRQLRALRAERPAAA